MKTLSDVKPGDLLIIQHRQDRRIVQVETVTSCRFKTKDGSTWNKKTAKKVGEKSGPWFTEHIKVPEEGEVEEIRLTQGLQAALWELEDLIDNLKNCKASQDLIDELSQATDRLWKFV